MGKSANKKIEAVLLDQTGQQDASGRIETSLLYEELRKTFSATGAPVEVDFRKLVSWLRMGDQLTHHIHPYPAKLLPHIAHFFLRANALHHGGRTVLDPFCGSGTVALEASVAGFSPLVADANPLSLLLTKAKTTPYDTDHLKVTSAKVIARAAKLRTAPTVEIINDATWYHPGHKKSLEIILRSILEVEDEDHKDFLKVCFSATARRVSFADPAVSVPVRLRVKDSFPEATNEKIRSKLNLIINSIPLKEFEKTIESNISRVADANTAFKSRNRAVVVGTDARKLVDSVNRSAPLASGTIPFVITSPPYGSAQKYIRASSLSLNWLGMAGPGQLSTLEGRSIGREHMPLNREFIDNDVALPQAYEALLKRITDINPLRGQITRKYLHEMQDVVREVARVISPGGKAVFVIGNNQVCGELLRNDDYLIYCFQKFGMTLEMSLIDHIKSRGLMTKRNRTASVISRESVLVFSKD